MNNIENLKDLIIYHSQNNENISVEVLYDEEDFWLTQKSMSKLFNVAENNIIYHLQNIFNSGELNKDSVIAVGHRVNSIEAKDFRIWSTQTLKEYIKKGFALNDEMLKNGQVFFYKIHYVIILLKYMQLHMNKQSHISMGK